uniref:Uncharacterized protein n=1 Tax=Haptolina brevifila TaxID=156173 RepID=A0A7S2GMS4_9EUKA
MPPLNIAPAAAWVTRKAMEQSKDRDKQTCMSLALFIKGLAIRSTEEEEALKEAHVYARKKGPNAAMKRAAAERRAEEERERRYLEATGSGALSIEVSKRAKAVALMQQASRQRREKSSRRDAQLAEQARIEQEERVLSQHMQQIEDIEQKLEAQQSRVLMLAGEALAMEEASSAQEEETEQADQAAAGTSFEPRRGLGMKLRDGRKTTPARVRRMALSSDELGVPNLNLEKALARARAKDKLRGNKQPSATSTASVIGSAEGAASSALNEGDAETMPPG